MDKEVRKLIQSLTVIDGVTVEVNGSHAKVYRDGTLLVVISKTPSDHRWKQNTLRDLRAKGITPGARIDKALRYTEGVTMEQLRAKLFEMKQERGARARFARFLQDEVTPMLGMDGYRSFHSAEASLKQFADGQGNLSEQKFVLVSEALRLWPAKQRADVPGEEIVPDPEPGIIRDAVLIDRPFPDETPGGATVTVELDVDSLSEILGRFGIKLTLNPGS